MAQAVGRCAPERLGCLRICRIRDRARGALGPVQGCRGDARLRGARAGSPSARGASGNRLARSRKGFPPRPPGMGMNERQKEGLGPFLSPLSVSKVSAWGVAKLVKAADFDSAMRGFESFLPSQEKR